MRKNEKHNIADIECNEETKILKVKLRYIYIGCGRPPTGLPECDNRCFFVYNGERYDCVCDIDFIKNHLEALYRCIEDEKEIAIAFKQHSFDGVFNKHLLQAINVIMK